MVVENWVLQLYFYPVNEAGVIFVTIQVEINSLKK